MNSLKAKELKLKILKLEKKQIKLREEIKKNYEDLVNICPHEETKDKHEYVEGGYLDRGYFKNMKICLICNKILSEKTENGFYG